MDHALPSPSTLSAAIAAKSELIGRIREAKPDDWGGHVAVHLDAMRRSGLRDHAALLTLLTELLGELPVSVSPTAAERSDDGEAGPASDPEALMDPLGLYARGLKRWLAGCARPRTSHDAHVQKMRDFIEAHYAEPIALTRLSAFLGREKGYLGTLFRTNVGCSVREYLARVRVQRAAEMIRQGQKIESVMLCVGYRGKTNFYQQFVRTMGLTPGIYYRLQHTDPRASEPGRYSEGVAETEL